MKFCRYPVRILAVILLLCLLSACGAKEKPAVTQEIKIWYINGSPAVVDALNSDSGVAADIRGFDSEEELATAFNTIRPDIIFCSMQQAEHMFDNGHLTALPGELFSGISLDADIVNAHFFLPVGGAVELITVDRKYTDSVITDFETMCFAADMPDFVSVSDYSKAFAALLACSGETYSGTRNRDIGNPAFVEVYNRFAELALHGQLAKENAVCRIASSTELAGMRFESTEIVPLVESDMPMLTEYYGFVCTGSAEGCESCISAILTGSRADKALRCGLVPVTNDASSHSDPLSAVLMRIKNDYAQIPVTVSCEWLNNSAEFNEWVSASLESIK